MGKWITMTDASRETGVSFRTWQRRVAKGWPSKPGNGREVLVWIAPQAQHLDVIDAIKALDAKVSGLALSRAAERSTSKVPLSNTAERIATSLPPVTRSEPRRPPAIAKESFKVRNLGQESAPKPRGPIDHEAILKRIESWVDEGHSESELAQLVGIHRCFFAQAKKGEKRSKRANRVWFKILSILEGREQERISA